MNYDKTSSNYAPPRAMRLTLEDALKIWYEEREKRAGEGPPGEHPTREELRGIVGPGGLLQAPPEMVDHISLCPQCMTEWSAAVRAYAEADESPSAPSLTEWSAAVRAHAEADESPSAPELDYGLLEAAATHERELQLQLHSVSGCYVLTLSPYVGDQPRGEITLTVREDLALSLQGRRVTVHTSDSGKALLDGEVTNGNLVRQCEDLAEVAHEVTQSGVWTVVVADSDT